MENPDACDPRFQVMLDPLSAHGFDPSKIMADGGHF